MAADYYKKACDAKTKDAWRVRDGNMGRIRFGFTACVFALSCRGGTAHNPLELVSDVRLPGGETRFDYQDFFGGHLVIAHMNDGSVVICNASDGSVIKELELAVLGDRGVGAVERTVREQGRHDTRTYQSCHQDFRFAGSVEVFFGTPVNSRRM